MRPSATASELCAAIERIGRPAVLKTRRFGYDGKGQATIGPDTVPEAAWSDVGRLPCILEAFVPFAREVRSSPLAAMTALSNAST